MSDMIVTRVSGGSTVMTVAVHNLDPFLMPNRSSIWLVHLEIGFKHFPMHVFTEFIANGLSATD